MTDGSPEEIAMRALGALALQSSRMTRDTMLMRMAEVAAGRSTCRRLQVGAILALEGRVLSMGYNGAPAGMPHCSPGVCSPDQVCTRTIHAEANAIAFAARHGVAVNGSCLYLTHSPCLDCAKLIINAGIKRVLYNQKYRDPTPLNYLLEVGINSVHYAP